MVQHCSTWTASSRSSSGLFPELSGELSFFQDLTLVKQRCYCCGSKLVPQHENIHMALNVLSLCVTLSFHLFKIQTLERGQKWRWPFKTCEWPRCTGQSQFCWKSKTVPQHLFCDSRPRLWMCHRPSRSTSLMRSRDQRPQRCLCCLFCTPTEPPPLCPLLLGWRCSLHTEVRISS